jgi:hypothetical protein
MFASPANPAHLPLAAVFAACPHDLREWSLRQSPALWKRTAPFAKPRPF